MAMVDWNIDAELRAIDGDGRTVEQMMEDSPFQEGPITDVTPDGEGGYSLSWGDGWGCGIPASRNPKKLVPKVGQRLRVYAENTFGRFYGLAFDGELAYFQTPLERLVDRLRHSAEYDREKRERFAAEQEKLDADYEALPAEFKARIARRRANSPRFRMDWEGYEMFTCTQAVAFAARAREAAERGENMEEVDVFWADRDRVNLAWEGLEGKEDWEPPADAPSRWLSWWQALHSKAYDYDLERFKERMPAYDSGHSGNTFGMACQLAALYIAAPDKVGVLHGAGAAVVGSEEYGDVDPELEAAEAPAAT